MNKCYACGQHKPSKYRFAWERLLLGAAFWWCSLILQVEASISSVTAWKDFWAIHATCWGVAGLVAVIFVHVEQPDWAVRTPDTGEGSDSDGA